MRKILIVANTGRHFSNVMNLMGIFPEPSHNRVIHAFVNVCLYQAKAGGAQHRWWTVPVQGMVRPLPGERSTLPP